jgi:hypothetical protein
VLLALLGESIRQTGSLAEQMAWVLRRRCFKASCRRLTKPPLATPAGRAAAAPRCGSLVQTDSRGSSLQNLSQNWVQGGRFAEILAKPNVGPVIRALFSCCVPSTRFWTNRLVTPRALGPARL